MILPAHTNRRALNRAWVTRWNTAKFVMCMATHAIITPSCLRVDSAIIFLKSHSVVALIPAISIVIEADIKRIVLNRGRELRKDENRIRRNTPAVTRVDE
jgi:hypothetical protein